VLYNFRIQSSVGFYSNFWRFWGTVKRSTPGHDVARARTAPAPRRLDIRVARAFPRPRASRGRAPSPGPCAPRRLEVRPPRVSPPCAPNRARRALRRPAIRPWLPPLHAHLPRPPPYHGRIFVTPSSRASEAAYLSAALPLARGHAVPHRQWSRRRRAHPSAPFRRHSTYPTRSLAPTETHPTARSHHRAYTSPGQSLPRLAPDDATKHRRRLPLHPNSDRKPA
jgi:hypothetical protein